MHRALAFTLVLAAGCRTPEPAPPPLDTSRAATSPWVKLATEPYKGKQDDVFFLTPELGWYVNGGGKIFKTTDGGKTFTEKLSKPGTYFRAVGFEDERHGFAGNLGKDYFPGVTDDIPLYETFDGGDTWAPVKDFPFPKGAGVCAINVERDAFVNAGKLDHRTVVHVAGRVGGPAYAARSVDGGKTWKLMDLTKQTAMILDVTFLDASTGFLAGGSDREVEPSHAQVLKTTDGGEHWTTVYESKRPFEITWKLSFPTRDTGYVTVQNYAEDAAVKDRVVARTTDGGNTWTELPLVSDHAQQEFGVAFATPDVGWVGGSKGGFQTLDGGKTWTHLEMGRAVNKVRVVPAPKGFVAYAIGVELFKLDAAAPQAP